MSASIKSLVITTSKQYALDWRDFIKGLLIAILTPIGFAIQQTLDAAINQNIPITKVSFNWQHLAMIGVSAASLYLIHNFIQPAHTEITPPVTVEQDSVAPHATEPTTKP